MRAVVPYPGLQQHVQGPADQRAAFGVRRIPALFFCAVATEPKAPAYGALQTLRAIVGPTWFSHVVENGGKPPHITWNEQQR